MGDDRGFLESPPGSNFASTSGHSFKCIQYIYSAIWNLFIVCFHFHSVPLAIFAVIWTTKYNYINFMLSVNIGNGIYAP